MNKNRPTSSATIIPIIDDIYDLITWGDFAREFFPDHSVTWFYNKMRGVDGNGGAGTFTQEEREQLKGGLCALADRLRNAASRL